MAIERIIYMYNSQHVLYKETSQTFFQTKFNLAPFLQERKNKECILKLEMNLHFTYLGPVMGETFPDAHVCLYSE